MNHITYKNLRVAVSRVKPVSPDASNLRRNGRASASSVPTISIKSSDSSWNGRENGSATRGKGGNYGDRDQPQVSPKGATTSPDAGIRAKDIVRRP